MTFNIFQKNQQIVDAKGSIPFWVIADRLGVHENTVRNWMKREMKPEQQSRVLAAIDDIKKELKQVH